MENSRPATKLAQSLLKRHPASLCDAAQTGNIDLVHHLLAAGADANVQGGPYGNPLQAAAWKGSGEIVALLIHRGAAVNAQGGIFGCALQAAAHSGSSDIIRSLIRNHADVNQLCGDYGSALQAAIINGHEDAAQALLEAGALIDVHSGIYGRPLQAAAYIGNLRIMAALLEKGADINAQGGKYGTALIAAAYGGNYEAVEFLVKQGADVTASSLKFGSAVCGGAWKGNAKIIAILIQAGAVVDSRSGEHGRALRIASWRGNRKAVDVLIAHPPGGIVQAEAYGTALQAAAWIGNVDIMQDLIEVGADINSEAGEYGTALHAAAWNGSRAAVHSLVQCRAEVDARDKRHGTAMQIAAWIGHVESMKQLIDAGADINATGGEYGTALRAAVWAGNRTAVRILIQRGADVNAQDKRYGTALQTAARAGRLEILQDLIQAGADVNAERGRYGTALEAAAETGNIPALLTLVELGARVDTPGNRWRDPLQLASLRGHSGNNSGTRQALVIKILEERYHTEKTRLENAVWEGHIDYLRGRLDRDVSPGVSCGDCTIMQLAATRGHVELVKLLIARGANVNQRSREYANTLQAAASAGDLQIAKSIIHLSDVNAQGGRLGSVLQAAVVGGNREIVKMLLDRDANINIQAGEFGCALQAAAWRGDRVLAEMLMANGADANTQGGKYGNALRAAAMTGHFELLDVLCPSYTTSGAQDEFSKYLHDVAWSGSAELVANMISRGADVNTKGGLYGNPLLAAISIGSSEIVQLLRDHGAEFAESAIDGSTPLHAAARSRDPSTLSLVLDAGADKYRHTEDDSGQMPLHLAARAGHMGVLRILGSRACDNFNPKDLDGRTPLHHAVEGGSTDAVQWLLDNGAAAEDRDFGDKSPFQSAFELRRHDILRILFPHSIQDLGAFRVSDWRRAFSMKNDVLLMSFRRSACFAIVPARQFRQDIWPNVLASPSFHRLPQYLEDKDEPDPTSTSLVILPNNQEPWDSPGLHFRWCRQTLKDGLISRRSQSKNIPSATTIARVPSKESFLECRHSIPILDRLNTGDVPSVLAVPLDLLRRNLDIAWIMTKPDRTATDSKTVKAALQNRVYFSTLEYVGIPESPLQLLRALVLELETYWYDVCDAAEQHLVTLRTQIFRSSGNAEQFRSLLKDAELRGILHNLLAKQVRTLRSTHVILADKKATVLHEVHDNTAFALQEKPDIRSALGEFEMSISSLERSVGEKLDNLAKLSQDLIQLEFNLTSIAETQKSISMNRSMKRLSWITFIFLPLMFISSLFGMNIDVLASNPAWWIYVPLAAGTMILTFAVWIVFKRNEGLENRVEARLGWLVSSRGSRGSHDEEMAMPATEDRYSRTLEFSAWGKKRS